MSIIRNTEGINTTEIEGNWTVFTDEFEAYAGQFSHFTAKEGTYIGNPEKDEGKETKYFKKGIWYSDAEGKNAITKAAIGQVVYFHIETRNIPDMDAVTKLPSKVGLHLYDEDGGAGGGDDPISVREVKEDGSFGNYVTEKEVTNNKIVYNLTLSDGLARFLCDRRSLFLNR